MLHSTFIYLKSCDLHLPPPPPPHPLPPSRELEKASGQELRQRASEASDEREATLQQAQEMADRLDRADTDRDRLQLDLENSQIQLDELQFQYDELNTRSPSPTVLYRIMTCTVHVHVDIRVFFALHAMICFCFVLGTLLLSMSAMQRRWCWRRGWTRQSVCSATKTGNSQSTERGTLSSQKSWSLLRNRFVGVREHLEG